MLQLRAAISESDYDTPVGLDAEGVVYRRRQARKGALGYDMYHETVPYDSVRGIAISPQSSANRILTGLGMVALGLVIMVVTIAAFVHGVILLGLLIFISPVLVWLGFASLFGRNGIHVCIDCEGEKKYTITLDAKEWETMHVDILAILREAKVNLDLQCPEEG